MAIKQAVCEELLSFREMVGELGKILNRIFVSQETSEVVWLVLIGFRESVPKNFEKETVEWIESFRVGVQKSLQILLPLQENFEWSWLSLIVRDGTSGELRLVVMNKLLKMISSEECDLLNVLSLFVRLGLDRSVDNVFFPFL